ncbi:hypothetical protein GpartN1_g2397.t1 [Galdieria partita]|uniref:Uncharacterized protein n=1 Tax=Galdieria partita TaxID=83374 RepID=A0A9C7PVC3_9RHOD|nr:hypothetical protein GpartN1_g2397.t1 [Galdieria partita]
MDAWNLCSSSFALRTAFLNSSYITQPIGDKSHEILCKLENIQRKKLEDIRNAPASLPLGVKSETGNVMEHSNPTTTTETSIHHSQLGNNGQMALIDDDAMIEEEEEETMIASPISSWME